MWQPKKIIVENLFSHSNTEFLFRNSELTVITGKNLDDEGQESNGSGKSVIIEAFAFALTGDFIRKISNIEAIKDDCDSLKVSLELQNDFLSTNMIIVREISLTKSSVCQIFINGSEKTDIPNVQEKNKFILEMIDIQKEDIFSYFIVSKTKMVSFLSSTDSVKKQIIGRFSGVDKIADVNKKVEAKVQELEREIKSYTDKQFALRSKIEVHKENLDVDGEKEKFEERKKSTLQSLNLVYEHTKTIVEQLKSALLLDENRVIEFEQKLSEIETDEELRKKYDEIETTFKEKKKARLEILEEIEQFKTLCTQIENKLKAVISCPKCKHEFNIQSPDFKVDDARESLVVIKDEIIKSVSQFNDLEVEYKNIQAELSATNVKIEEISKKRRNIQTEINSLKNDIQNEKLNIKNQEIKIKDAEDKIAETEKLQYTPPNLDSISDKIKEAENEIAEMDESIALLKNVQSDIIVWDSIFKKFKVYLYNKAIYSIEVATNNFLNLIKTDLSLKIDTYKLDAKGELKESFVVKVMRNGEFKGSFFRHSEGEKLRMVLANIIAQRNLINNNSESGGLDILFLDEIIESADNLGVNEIFKNLNSLQSTICCITHAFNDSINVNTVRFVKQFNNSYIE